MGHLLSRFAQLPEDAAARPTIPRRARGSRGTRIAPRTARRPSARLGEHVERGQPVRRQDAARAQAGGGVHRGGDADRAVEGRGQVDGRAAQARRRGVAEHAGDPAAARDLQAHRVGRPGLRRAGLGGGLVHRQRHVHLRAHRAQRLDAVHRLLGELDARGREVAQVRDRLVDRPGAVGVDPDAPRARRSPPAPRRPGRRRRRSPTLTLTQSKPRLPAAAAAAAAPARSSAAIIALTGIERAASTEISSAHRARRALAGEVPQREVDRRERLREVALGPAGRRAAPRAAARPRAGQHLRVGVERGAHGRQRHAVVALERRGLADAGEPVVGVQRAPAAARARSAFPRRRAAARAARACRCSTSSLISSPAGRPTAARRTRAAAARCARARR